jgi:hypothetical protein
MNLPATPKRSCLGTLAEITRQLMAILLAVLFTLAAALTLLGQGVYGILREPESYTTLAGQTHLVTRLRGMAVSSLVSTTLKANPQFLQIDASQLPPQTWDNIAAALLPEDWLASNFKNLTGSLLAWLNTQQDTELELRLDLIPIKTALRSEKGILAILPLLQNTPACTAGQQAQIGEGGLISCLPEGQDLALFASQAANIVAAMLPDEIALQSEAYIQPQTLRSLATVRTYFRTAGAALVLAVRVSLLLLDLYALLQSATLRRMLTGLGWPFYAAAIVVILLVGILYAVIQWGFELWVPVNLFSQQPALRPLLIDLARSVGAMLQSRLLVSALILLTAGLVCQLLAFGVKRWQVYQQAKAAPVETQRPQSIKKQFR